MEVGGNARAGAGVNDSYPALVDGVSFRKLVGPNKRIRHLVLGFSPDTDRRRSDNQSDRMTRPTETSNTNDWGELCSPRRKLNLGG